MAQTMSTAKFKANECDDENPGAPNEDMVQNYLT